jgi:hypothetical protein
MIKQDKQSRNKGRVDAMRGVRSKCPKTLDELAYSSDYIEGQAQRAKRPFRVISGLQTPVVIHLADRRQRVKGTTTAQERRRLAWVRPNRLRDRRAQSLYCAITLTTRRNPWGSAKRRNKAIARYAGEFRRASGGRNSSVSISRIV